MIIIAGDVNKLLDELGATMPGVGTVQAAVEFMTKGELGLVTILLSCSGHLKDRGTFLSSKNLHATNSTDKIEFKR